MSLGQWSQQLRLVRSLRLLAAGEKITRVAVDLGSSTPSAFIAMFRKALGMTPRQYFEATRCPGPIVTVITRSCQRPHGRMWRRDAEWVA